jgi:hypothetical protein
MVVSVEVPGWSLSALPGHLLTSGQSFPGTVSPGAKARVNSEGLSPERVDLWCWQVWVDGGSFGALASGQMPTGIGATCSVLPPLAILECPERPARHRGGSDQGL